MRHCRPFRLQQVLSLNAGAREKSTEQPASYVSLRASSQTGVAISLLDRDSHVASLLGMTGTVYVLPFQFSGSEGMGTWNGNCWLAPSANSLKATPLRPSSSKPFSYDEHIIQCPRGKVKCFRDKNYRFFSAIFVQNRKMRVFCLFLLTNLRFYA